MTEATRMVTWPSTKEDEEPTQFDGTESDALIERFDWLRDSGVCSPTTRGLLDEAQRVIRSLEGERARVRTYDEEALAQALYRTLYDAGVSFSSNDVIPKLTATVRAVMTDHTDGSERA